MFCCQLEELIHWLYTVVDVTGSWVPPSPDTQSLSASLHRYLVGVSPFLLLPGGCHLVGVALALLPPLSCAAGITGMVQSALGLQSPNLGSPGTSLEETAHWAILPQVVCVSKTLLRNSALLLVLPGVQEGCGQPQEPD